MTLNHRNSVLAAAVLVFVLGGTLTAQDLREMKLFAPADLSQYGSGPQPKQGYFFVFDGLQWSTSRPDVIPIGFPNLRRQVFHDPLTREVQSNSLNTGQFNSQFHAGNRIQFGRVYGRQGWLFSSYRLNDQVQTSFNRNVDIVFKDPNNFLRGWVADMLGYDVIVDPLLGIAEDQRTNADYGNFQVQNLPVSFDELLVENRVETWGVELMYLRRSRQTGRGGFFEFLAGVRYLEFDETFRVEARGNDVFAADGSPLDVVGASRFVFDQSDDGNPDDPNPAPIRPGNLLADSNWITEAENHIIGPQIGGRWFRKNGRVTLSAEGRFFAGLNMQNLRNRGVLGSQLDAPVPYAFDELDFDADAGYPYMPLLREPYDFDHKANIPTWSPGAELSLDLMVQLTSAVSVEVGWNGLWLGGIARASAMPDYTISNSSIMGIRRGANRQTVFLHGLNVGVTINR